MGRKAKEIIDLSSSLADIWRVLSEEERDLIRKNARFVHYKKNEAIYIEEEQPQDLMCLLKGKVKIFKNGVGGRVRSEERRVGKECRSRSTTYQVKRTKSSRTT